MVRLHTRPVCYLVLLRCTLTVIFVKHKSMMTVIRVHVYTTVCTCHAHTTRDIGVTYKYDDNTFTASEDTPWYAAIPDFCACFAKHMIMKI